MSVEPHLVIFDCDGTLVDGQHMVVASMREAFLAHGLPEPDPRKTRSVIGLSLAIAVGEVLGDAHVHKVDHVTRTFREVFHDLRAQKSVEEPFYDGARDLIQELSERDDVLLAIATGKGRRAVDSMIENERWQGHFISIQTSDNAPSKPHPGMVLNAVAESGVDVRNAVMIGDTSFDMEMARAAGTHAMGVAWGYHAVDRLTQSGAHMIVDDFPSLRNALETHFQREGQ